MCTHCGNCADWRREQRRSTSRRLAVSPGASALHWHFILDRFASLFIFFSSRRRHTRSLCDWSSDVCSSDLLSCFLLPRWTPDGAPNALRLQRLKDKLGNRANASSEVEFQGALAWLVGEEGRGIPTIIEMATYTRLDCALGTSGLMRQAVAQAIHHARPSTPFHAKLLDQRDIALAARPDEAQARRLVEMIVLAVQAALLVRFAPPAIADGFCASRLAGERGAAFGAMPAGIDFRAIVERAAPALD